MHTYVSFWFCLLGYRYILYVYYWMFVGEGEEITCILSTFNVVLIGMKRLCLPQTAQFWSKSSWWRLN